MTRHEWILVLNANHARLIEGLVPPRSPAPPERALAAHVPKLTGVMSDKPGRSFSSGAPGRRSSMAYASDPVRDAERAFVRQAVEMVEAARIGGRFDSLAVFAAPEMLGLLREAMPEALRRLVSREEACNLAGLDPEPLQEALRARLGRA